MERQQDRRHDEVSEVKALRPRQDCQRTAQRSLFAWGWSEYQLAPMEAGRDAGGSVHQPLVMQMPMPMPMRSTVKSSTHPCLSMHQNFVSRVAASNLQNKMGMHGVHAYVYFWTWCV